MQPAAGGDGEGEGELPARRYANDLAVEVSLSTCELRFGQRHGDGAAPQVHSRIVASPVHLATFGRVIQASIARYEARFGAIPDGGGG
jgi:hypothetical protein